MFWWLPLGVSSVIAHRWDTHPCVLTLGYSPPLDIPTPRYSSPGNTHSTTHALSTHPVGTDLPGHTHPRYSPLYILTPLYSSLGYSPSLSTHPWDTHSEHTHPWMLTSEYSPLDIPTPGTQPLSTQTLPDIPTTKYSPHLGIHPPWVLATSMQ